MRPGGKERTPSVPAGNIVQLLLRQPFGSHGLIVFEFLWFQFSRHGFLRLRLAAAATRRVGNDRTPANPTGNFIQLLFGQLFRRWRLLAIQALSFFRQRAPLNCPRF
jgi:hypothetical protein